MREIDDQKHYNYFRMSSSAFDELLRRIETLISHQRTHSAPISSSQRLAVTLRFLATGCSYQSLAASHELGSATVGCIVKEVCEAIWTALKDDVVAFPSVAKWMEIQEEFWSLWNFPNCVGAIDGKHIRVRAPANSGSSFHNYKGYFSFILMAVCDARGALIKGELHLPPPSPLPGAVVRSPPVFVADEAFPLKVNLMRPFSGTNLTAEQRKYNYQHCRARWVIENAFGILAARWRVFGKAMECSVDTTELITKGCVALHNFLCGTDQLQAETARYISRVDEGDVLGEWRQVVETDTNLLDTGRLTSEHAT
ncbi:putative nuclease HARBI1 [Nothobranchius furzeri]|uniref:putative nuclease HARBI1 n=1 Tax=Nothobranchius furzeri TaxID=105023 RepID=UPI0039048591